jgi:hypothetical protein
VGREGNDDEVDEREKAEEEVSRNARWKKKR